MDTNLDAITTMKTSYLSCAKLNLMEKVKGYLKLQRLIHIRKLFCFIVLSICLTACGGGSTESSPEPLPSPTLFSTTLNWQAPTNRMDGSSFSGNEISGYKIYMGSSKSDLALLKTIEDPQILSTEINDLPKGTHYFAIAIYDSEALESPLSNIIIREF